MLNIAVLVHSLALIAGSWLVSLFRLIFGGSYGKGSEEAFVGKQGIS